MQQEYEYTMVQVPPTIEVKSKEFKGQEAAHYLQNIVYEYAQKGWEFYRVDTIGVEIAPGCLGALLGQKTVEKVDYVITFRHKRKYTKIPTT